MRANYRAAVIGHTGRGNYGHGLDVVWREIPEVELVAVADADKRGLVEAAKRLELKRTYSDYRVMLDEVKPDVVSVAPRWLDEHRDMVVAAAERGIHVYLEKPFCRSLEEADDMVRACESTHTKLAIAHQTRYSPKIPVVKEILSSGVIGEPLELRGRGKEDRRGGGEDLWVLGTHIMDLIRNLAGDASWCASTVTVEGRAIRADDVVQGNEGIGPLAGDTVHAMYGLSAGRTAYFDTNRGKAARNSRFGLAVYGSGGILWMGTGYLPRVAVLREPGWVPRGDGAHWEEVSSAGLGKSEPLDDGGLHAGNIAAVRDLLAAIEEDRQPESSVYDARAATEMIVAAFEAQRLQKRVDLPLATRQNPLTLLG